MTIQVIWTSPNEDGLTAAAKDQLLAGLAQTEVTTEVTHLNKLKIGICTASAGGRGWGKCRREGACVQNDDFTAVYTKIQAADAVIWVTPVYWHDLSENLKALLDRMRRCETAHNHFLKDKQNLIVACAGGSGRGATQCLLNLETILGHMDMRVADRLQVTRFNRAYMLPALKEAAYTFAQNLSAS